jgi:hypothetical protein
MSHRFYLAFRSSIVDHKACRWTKVLTGDAVRVQLHELRASLVYGGQRKGQFDLNHDPKVVSGCGNIVSGTPLCIKIDFNDEQCEKGKCPRRDSFDPDSNVISESDEQSLKQ